MKLKEFFLSLATHNQAVEIYFNEENRDPVFGFKINNIDSEVLLAENDGLWTKIESEINNAFLSTNLIDDGEGDSTYFILSDLSCIKTAKYFSWANETELFWIESHETEFYIENLDFPFNGVLINKELDSFKIDEEKTLKKMLAYDQYNQFTHFYKELLSEFQEMQIELQLEVFSETLILCSIIHMDGFYRKTLEFTLLDASEIDVSKDELKQMLLKCFDFEEQLANQILEFHSEK
jgi:hypothetical protein